MFPSNSAEQPEPVHDVLHTERMTTGSLSREQIDARLTDLLTILKTAPNGPGSYHGATIRLPDHTLTAMLYLKSTVPWPGRPDGGGMPVGTVTCSCGQASAEVPEARTDRERFLGVQVPTVPFPSLLTWLGEHLAAVDPDWASRFAGEGLLSALAPAVR